MGVHVQYWTAVGIGVLLGAAAVVAARAYGGRIAHGIARGLALVLLTDAAVFVARPVADGTWTARASLPLALCDLALAVAAVACWWPSWQLGVELTYFWGLAGTLQAVVTPDLSVRFPDPEFFLFVAGHVGIVLAAVLLVVGLRRRPRPGSAWRVFAITAGYTAAVGVVDAVTGGNYMYLRRLPGAASLLSVLGPWPWYLLGAAAVGGALFAVLALPFRRPPHGGAGPLGG